MRYIDQGYERISNLRGKLKSVSAVLISSYSLSIVPEFLANGIDWFGYDIPVFGSRRT